MYATDTTKGSRSLLFLQADPNKDYRLNRQEVPFDLPSQQFALMALRKFSSYSFLLVRVAGLEPTTHRLKVYCSTKLSYTRNDDGIGQVGLEPTRHYCQGILSPQRLPFRHKPEASNRICLITSACGQFLYQLAWQKISLGVYI